VYVRGKDRIIIMIIMIVTTAGNVLAALAAAGGGGGGGAVVAATVGATLHTNTQHGQHNIVSDNTSDDVRIPGRCVVVCGRSSSSSGWRGDRSCDGGATC